MKNGHGTRTLSGLTEATDEFLGPPSKESSTMFQDQKEDWWGRHEYVKAEWKAMMQEKWG